MWQVFISSPRAAPSLHTTQRRFARYQATYGPLMKYMIRKYNWSQHDAESINWKSHGTAIKRRNMKQKSHLVKLLHGTLPTNHRLHRNDRSRRGCPACSHNDETWDHILRCRRPSRHGWRCGFLEEMCKTSQKWQTRPELRDILLDGVSGWLDHRSDDEHYLPAALYNEEFERLIEKQNSIGWHHVILGRYCWEWSDFQEAHYVTRSNYNLIKKCTGNQWQAAIISQVWSQWYKLWELRNRELHGVDTTRQAQVARRNAVRALRELYALKENVEPSVQSLLMADIRDHVANPTWQIQNWLAVNENILRASFRHVKKKSIQGVRSIRQYFQAR